MRDLGVFTAKSISSHELIEFLSAFSLRAGLPFQKRPNNSMVGGPLDVLYVSDETAAANGYFSQEEITVIRKCLGFDPASYVSIHFTSTDKASGLAKTLAEEISRMWEGVIDYSGAGGQLGVPPARF